QLTGLAGSAAAMAAAALWQQRPLNHVFILRDKEEAAYFHNDLEALLQSLDIHYFPDSFKKTGNFDLVNKSHVMLRTEALMKFSGDGVRKKILVTYPEAVFEKVAPPAAFASAMIHLRTGEALVLEPLLDRLVSLGFSRTDFVYEPG